MVQSNSSVGSAIDEEKQELAALLAHPEIARSANLVRLLSFVCDKYFEGKPDEIRESSIAIQALGCKETDFDSHADPIVRVTARTLRKRLDAFYNHEGRNRPLRLVLPVGQYVPKFVPWNAAGNPEFRADDIDAQHDVILPAPDPVETFHIPTVLDHPPSVAMVESTRKSPAWRKPLLVVVLLAAASAASFWVGRRSSMTRQEIPFQAGPWDVPVWSDEFEGAAGELPDPSNWRFDTGRGGAFGNDDIMSYCAPGSSAPPCDARRPNALKDGAGHLMIRAVKTRTGKWTSARLKTQGLREFQYGRIEARMKLPTGAGLWPAFWMLGSNFDEAGWPNSGSVDFMENVSAPDRANSLGPAMIRATVHGPGYSGGNGLWQNYILPGGGRIDDDSFHTYGVIWSPNVIQFYVDDPSNIYFVRTASDVPAGAKWILNNRFFLILNLAVGGEWPGPPNASTPDPSVVLVDYVRVYKAAQVPGPSISIQPIVVQAGSSTGAPVYLSARPGSGRMYLSCSGAPANSTCSLVTPMVDFSNSGTQQNTLKIQTESISGTGRFVTPAGEYRLTVTATTVSGDTFSTSVPLRIE